MRSWRNWQTRQVEGLVPAMACWFKSSRPHLNEIRGSIPTKKSVSSLFSCANAIAAFSTCIAAFSTCAVYFCPVFFCRLHLSSIPGPSAAGPGSTAWLTQLNSVAHSASGSIPVAGR